MLQWSDQSLKPVRRKLLPCLDSSKPTWPHLLWATGLCSATADRFLKFMAEVTAMGRGEGASASSQLSEHSRALQMGPGH